MHGASYEQIGRALTAHGLGDLIGWVCANNVIRDADAVGKAIAAEELEKLCVVEENEVMDLYPSVGNFWQGLPEDQKNALLGRVHEGAFAVFSGTLKNRIMTMGKFKLDKEVTEEEAQKVLDDYKAESRAHFFKNIETGEFKPQRMTGSFVDLRKIS